MNIFFLSCSWHERIIYRASGVKLILCGHGKGRRDLSAEHSMQITVGFGKPARGSCYGPRPGRPIRQCGLKVRIRPGPASQAGSNFTGMLFFNVQVMLLLLQMTVTGLKITAASDKVAALHWPGPSTCLIPQTALVPCRAAGPSRAGALIGHFN